MRIGIEVEDTHAIGGIGRGKWEQRQVCYDTAIVWHNETVDIHDDNSGDDDDNGDIKNDAGGNMNGEN